MVSHLSFSYANIMMSTKTKVFLPLNHPSAPHHTMSFTILELLCFRNSVGKENHFSIYALFKFFVCEHYIVDENESLFAVEPPEPHYVVFIVFRVVQF